MKMGVTTCTETEYPLEPLPVDSQVQSATALDTTPTSPLAEAEAGDDEIIGKKRPKTVAVVTVCATGLNAILSSLVIITFPKIASDLRLGPELLTWYVIPS